VAGGGPPFGSLTAFLVAAGAPPDVGAERGQAPPRPARRAPLRRAPRASPRPQSTLPRRTPMATPRRGPTAPPRESPVTQPSTAPPLLPPYDTAPHGTAPTLGWPGWRMAYGNLENSIPLTGASPEASAEVSMISRRAGPPLSVVGAHLFPDEVVVHLGATGRTCS
jgi:hypothetical protein